MPINAPLSPAVTSSITSSVNEETSYSETSDDVNSSDVAVVGMACRVAGGNDSPGKLWEFLMNKGDASGEIPAMRWEPYRHRDPRDAKELDKITSRGYFVENLEDFDCTFFGISPKEAEMMDPQQRLSLEVCWEALENAGIPPQSLAGSNTAVYMGVNSDDYSKLLLDDLSGIEAWMGIGTAFCGIPNRISYQLNLMGSSEALDAACASSLVAIHQGRQALLNGETNVAIAGGVNAMCGPGLTKVLDKAGAISPEGICRSFDDDARGYGRGEGAAIIILKRMNDALENGDKIHAILKGSAVAQDGRTNGIMAPNGKAQELVAREALEVAGVDPSTIGYVEAHATSTPVGDPIEVTAISNVYGKGRKAISPCYLGSIKPNIGHLEAGAGAMGFIKAVMAVSNGTIPPQANLNELNSKINWNEAGVQVVRDSITWQSDALRRAAICSYGYGGTVSHAVIEEYSGGSESVSVPGGLDEDIAGLNVLLISAPQKKRLTSQAREYQSWILANGKKHSLASIATTLAIRRDQYDYRAAFIVESHEDAAEKLKSFSEGATDPWSVSGKALDSSISKGSAWVFSGHGAQWKEMGRDMLSNTVFYEAIASIDMIVRTEMGFSALQVLENGHFEASDKVQVLTYSMQIGLAAVLKSKGISPQAVIGHSVGEIAASVVAGALTANEGAIIVCRRAVLYREVMRLGSMILVSRAYPEIQREIGPRQDIAAAIESSPSSCVVSGAVDVVSEFAEKWKARGIKVLKVNSDIAFHSPVLNKFAKPLTESLFGTLTPKAPSIKLYSTSLPDPRGQNPRDAEYWANNMINPVLLAQTVNAVAEDGFRVFVEVSSHPIVSQSISETLIDKDIEDCAVIPTMIRGKPAEKSILSSAAQLHCRGIPVSWKTQMSGTWAHDVPNTIWNHQACWRKVRAGPLNSTKTHDVDKHTLLGQRIQVFGENTTLFTTTLDQDTKPFPGNHPLHGTEIVPAAVLLNTFFHGTGAQALSDIVLRVPVAISAPRDIQVVVQQGQVKLTSRLIQSEGQISDDLSWVTHTTGRFTDGEGSVEKDEQDEDLFVDIAAISTSIGTRLKDTFSIDYLADVGVSAMGFPWAVMEHFGNKEEMIAKVDVAPALMAGAPLSWDPQSWAPIFDAATSIGSTIFFNEPRLRMPAQIDRINIHGPLAPPKIGYIHARKANGIDLAVDVDITDDNGKLLANFKCMRFAEIEGTPGASGSVESLVHQVSWPPILLAEEPASLGHVVFVSRDVDILESYENELKSQTTSISKYSSVEELKDSFVPSISDGKPTVLIYIPGRIASFDEVSKEIGKFCIQLLDTIKYAASLTASVKVYTITNSVFKGEDATALAQAPLHGLGRIIASEQPDIWGGLIDTENLAFPLQTIKYVQGADVVRVSDGVARAARLRPLPHNKLLPNGRHMDFFPRPEGTYLITGGLGALGLEVASFLVEKSARRLVLISRRTLPPRDKWDRDNGPLSQAIQTIAHLEKLGTTVYVVSVDLGAEGSERKLRAALDHLALPPVLGVVHAAGLLEDQLILNSTAESFRRVLAPKVEGSLALHRLFPVKSLDFFVLFSSCGQLFGFPGQGSYASGNAFLDSLATYRRNQGDNCIAIQWTSWHGLGMAASTDFINAELESKGITDVTRDDAFRAWDRLAKYDTDHGVVLRSLAFDHDEPLPTPILSDIAIRRPIVAQTVAGEDRVRNTSSIDGRPESGPALKEHLSTEIRNCIVQTLQLGSIDDVDPQAALSDLGMDSVMTVALRRQLQQSLGVKVPPTLTWSHPTASHLQSWFMEKLEKNNG
ncbi:hypothetical protein MMC22_005927 [Lobaria immixta]|nr:hypothetical protein [Lobaria immixta]